MAWASSTQYNVKTSKHSLTIASQWQWCSIIPKLYHCTVGQFIGPNLQRWILTGGAKQDIKVCVCLSIYRAGCSHGTEQTCVKAPITAGNQRCAWLPLKLMCQALIHTLVANQRALAQLNHTRTHTHTHTHTHTNRGRITGASKTPCRLVRSMAIKYHCWLL